ncbi:MAG TPA: MFS transporter [Ignavibacteriales bacterium]|nr:MFS transporter [Ignavibacteriales bacterium]
MNKKSSLLIIFLTVFIDLLGFGILIPILPTFASKNLHVSDFGIGTLVAIFSLMQFLFNPVFGKLSDRFGRKRIIMITLCMTGTSYFIFSIAHSYWLLFFSRMLAGLGGSNLGVAQAYIADVTEKHERSKGMGMMGAAFGLGFVLGPLMGGFLSHFGYAMVGIASGCFSFTAFFFAMFFLKEPPKGRTKAKLTLSDLKLFDLKFAARTFRNPGLGLMIGLFFITTFSYANINGTLAILGYKHYGFTDQQNGMLFGVLGIFTILIQGIFIRVMAGKIQERNLIIFGMLSMSVGLSLLPFGWNFASVAGIISILAIGNAVMQPTALSMVSKYASDTEQGAVLGLNQSMSSLGRVLGPLWGGFSYDFLGYQTPFLTGGIVMFCTAIFCIFFFERKKSENLETENV